jgi:hypothetical protein
MDVKSSAENRGATGLPAIGRGIGGGAIKGNVRGRY